MLIYSHGGLNAAPVGSRPLRQRRGLQVVAVTSGDNCKQAKPTTPAGRHWAAWRM